VDLSDSELRAKIWEIKGKRIHQQRLSEYVHSVVVPVATYSPWLTNSDFISDRKLISSNTLVDPYRCYELWCMVAQSAKVPGDVLEVGVWRGGTGCLMALRLQRLDGDRKVYLCDTFTGVVKAGENDPLYKNGAHRDASKEIVQDLIDSCNLNNTIILQGIFPDDTGPDIQEKRFSLCHIDVDTYASARDVFEWVWPRLCPGGAIIFDDCGFAGCEGVTKLFGEISNTVGAVAIYNLNGHGILIKVGC
jgi:O-methyltransferase